MHTIPLGFQSPPVLDALAKFKAPKCGALQYAAEVDGLVCHFDCDDDELLLNAVYANGLEIDIDNLTLDYRTRLLEMGYVERKDAFEYERDCMAEREAA